MSYILGFDIGGTKCAVILAKTQGDDIEFIKKVRFETVGGCKAVMARLMDTARAIMVEFGLKAEQLTAGVSCGGPLDSGTGEILNPPNLPDFNVNIVKLIKDELGVSARLMNDADACAVAEWKYGAGRGCKNVVFLTFGTGLGAGLILNGRLYRGANGNAGEVGHIRLCKDGPIGYGKRGSFEGFCSGGGIKQLAQAKANELIAAGITPAFVRTDVQSVTTKDVAEAAKAGCPYAKEVMATSGDYFGRGLSVIVDILNPEMIIAGSVYARSGELLEESMYKSLKQEALAASLRVCRIEKAVLGEQIGDYGAVVASMDV